MILEFLQPDPSLLDGATVLLRAGYYAASLGAAGLVMFGAGFGHRLTGQELDRLRLWIVVAALFALALSLLALALRVLVLTAGADILDPAVWSAVMRSRIGDAFWLRVGGLVLILAAALPWRAGPFIAVAGAIGVVASYAAMGHSMLYRPRQEIAALVIVHLAVVAFWIGSLLPLALVAQRLERAGAAALIEDWSKAALVAVGLVVVSGGLLIWHLAPRLDLITGSWWGHGLIAKLALVAGLMGFAAVNKLRLTPALARGEFDAGDALARSIKLETFLVLAVFWAAAEMVSVHPIDIGHRISG
jgi:putative copper export protein